MDARELENPAVLCSVLEGCSMVESHPGRSTRGLAGWREILFPTQALTWSGSTGSEIIRSQPHSKAPRQERGQSRHNGSRTPTPR